MNLLCVLGRFACSTCFCLFLVCVVYMFGLFACLLYLNASILCYAVVFRWLGFCFIDSSIGLGFDDFEAALDFGLEFDFVCLVVCLCCCFWVVVGFDFRSVYLFAFAVWLVWFGFN